MPNSRPAHISTVRLDERRRPGGINVRRPLAGTRTSRPRKSAKNIETPGAPFMAPPTEVIKLFERNAFVFSLLFQSTEHLRIESVCSYSSLLFLRIYVGLTFFGNALNLLL